jgi:hypothetical protein
VLSKEQKKEAISKFKEQKPSLGIYAVRCTANGQVWVGSSRNLNAARNAIWFSLRNAGHREESLQHAWNSHGAPAFEFEILEKLKEDVATLAIADLLKEKKQYWMKQLDASGLL